MQTKTLSHKFLSVLMAIVMVVSLQVPTLAFAAGSDEAQGGESQGAQVLSLGSFLPQAVVSDGDTITGGDQIVSNGTYYLADDATGTITIGANLDDVVIVGDRWDSENKTFTTPYYDVNIVVGNESTLTVQDVYFDCQEEALPSVDLADGATLKISGHNLMDRQGGYGSYAIIHIGAGDSGTLAGDGVLYMYKHAMAAGIGGNGNEGNGNITFADGHWFIKGTKTGAVIGSDSSTEKPGDIIINGGELYVKGVARGALIGGSNQGKSGDIYINGGLIELFEDFSGPAIGAGSASNAGNLYVNGGSIKTALSSNSANSYGEAADFGGMPRASWAAVKALNASDYALLSFDASEYISDLATSTVTVYMDDGQSPFYSGRAYTYVTNEVKNPNVGSEPAGPTGIATVDNWLDNDVKWLVSEEDYGASAYPNKSGSYFVPEKSLYFALSKQDHTMDVNGDTYNVTWDEDAQEFTYEKVEDIVVTFDTQGGTEIASQTLDSGDTATQPADPRKDAVIFDEWQLDGQPYSFDTPVTESITLTATYKDYDWDSKTWAGGLDFSWYDENDVKTEYHLQTPAQWEALAWICSEHLAELGSGTTLKPLGTGTYTNGNVVATKGAIPTKQNVFAAAQFYLDSDIDMGGVYDEAANTWSGFNYYPIGSQGANDKNAGNWYGKFYGSFDGQGHYVNNVYANRGSGQSYQSVGLFGRVGAPDGEAMPSNNITIENFGVTGYIHSGRSVGGIVGKTLHVASGYVVTIKNCVNKATITSTDKKGVGGICGAFWNSPVMENCYSWGSASGGTPRGSIVGGNEGTITNVYSTQVAPVSGEKATGNATLNNGYQPTGASGGQAGTAKTLDEMKTQTFVDELNNGGTAFKANCGGYPVLSWEEATEHSWGVPTYEWADDYSSVTATRTCSVCGEEETETVDATSEVTKQPTAIEPGVRTWTSAEFENDAFEVQTTTEEIPALGELEVVHVGNPLWVAGKSADITAQATNLKDGETVTSWVWEYSKDGTNWKKTGAKMFNDDAESVLYIPECTQARKAPMAWRVTATTSLGRTATTEGQSLEELKDLEVVKKAAATWVEGEDAWVTAMVQGLASDETVESWQWYYSKDDTNWKKTGAASSIDGSVIELFGFACTNARKAPMAWCVKVTTSMGRTATSVGISLEE